MNSGYKTIMHIADMMCIFGILYMVIIYEVKNPWLVTFLIIFTFLSAEIWADKFRSMKDKD